MCRLFRNRGLVIAFLGLLASRGHAASSIRTLWSVGANSWSTTTTEYVSWGSLSQSTTQTSADTWSPGVKMIIYGFSCAVSATPASGNRIFTLMQNNAAVGSSCTITAQTCSATNNPPLIIASGDLISLRSTRTTSTAMGGGCLFRVGYAPTL